MMKRKSVTSRLKAAAALAVLAVTLAGCVVYPARPYGYAPGYYAGPVVAPTVVVRGGWGWGWGWRGGYWR